MRAPWVLAVLSALRAVASVGPPLRMSLPGPGPTGSASDSQLVAAAKYGDPGAFEALVARHAAGLHAVARRLVGDDLARDVVQDSLFAAYRSLRRFRGDASFGTYLHGIVVNRCRRVGPRWKRSTVAPDALIAAPSPSPGPEDVAVGNDLRGRVEGALRGLPAGFREALALREFADLSYDEIARVLGVPIGTVRSRIARGRALLRDELERIGVRP